MPMRNVFDPYFMRKVKKAYERYKSALGDGEKTHTVSREAFMDVDERGAAWYMGHMAHTLTQLEEKVKAVDFVIEIRDARLPFSTENPNLQKLTADRPRLIIFNKAEMAHDECNLAIQRYYESQGNFALFTSAQKTWRDTVEVVQRFVRHVLPPKEFKTVAHCGLVIGMPNVGKSTLINSLRLAHEYQFHREDMRRSRTPETVSIAPGTTRSVRLVPISNDPKIVLYDTPGLTLPGCFSKEAGFKLAACGIIPMNNQSLTPGLVSRYLYDVFQHANVMDHLGECMRLPRTPVGYDDCINLICESRGRAAQTDMGNLTAYRGQQLFVQDFMNGRLGKLTLDRLPEAVKRTMHVGAVDETAPRISSGFAEEDLGNGATQGAGTPEEEVLFTHEVQSETVHMRYPDHMADVMKAIERGPEPKAAAGGKAKAFGGDVISRKQGPIAKMSTPAAQFTRLKKTRRMVD